MGVFSDIPASFSRERRRRDGRRGGDLIGPEADEGRGRGIACRLVGGNRTPGGGVGRSEVQFLVRLIDQAFDRRAWHGTNLMGSLRGVALDEATFRPNPHRHNIWELAVHAAYWKYAVRRRLTGEKRGS